MFKDISKTDKFPKTLVIRNREGGMIWQIYHVEHYKTAEILADKATKNAFEAITLEDYQPEYEETWPEWRNSATTDVELRLLEGDNKIQYLIDNKFITKEDVVEYFAHLEDNCNTEWESNDPNAPDYYDTQDVEWPTK